MGRSNWSVIVSGYKPPVTNPQIYHRIAYRVFPAFACVSPNDIRYE